MPGFNPLGSRPIASIGGGDLPGTYVNAAGTGDLILDGYLGSFTGASPFDVSETVRESLFQVGGGGIEVSVVVREALAAADGTQLAIETSTREILRSLASLDTILQGGLWRETALHVTSDFRAHSFVREALFQIESELRTYDLTRETLEGLPPGAVREHLFVRETLIGTTTGSSLINASVSIIW